MQMSFIVDIIDKIETTDIYQIPRNITGVYILTRVDGKKYVGSSDYLIARIKQHKNKGICNITIFVTNTIYDALLLEYGLIRDIKPELNFGSFNSMYHSKKYIDYILIVLEQSHNIKITEEELFFWLNGEIVNKDNYKDILKMILEIKLDIKERLAEDDIRVFFEK